MTLDTFHLNIIRGGHFYVVPPLYLFLSLRFVGSWRSALTQHCSINHWNHLLRVHSIVSLCEMEQQVGQTLAELLWEPTW